MEKEGLVRGIKFIEEHNLSIGLLVSDRHRQIEKWLKIIIVNAMTSRVRTAGWLTKKSKSLAENAVKGILLESLEA